MKLIFFSPLLFSLLLFSSCKKEFTSSILSSQKAHFTTSDQLVQIKVNVKDYGAKGDGFTDDVVAFQAAENFVSSNGGGTVYVPAGVYIVSQPFYHRNFVTLIGDGDKSIVRNKIT